MDRRTFLKTTAVGASASIAGCPAGGSGGGSTPAADTDGSGGDTEPDEPASTGTVETTSGPASFEDVSLSAPESVVIEEEFSITVETRNAGGEAGAFADTLEMAGEDSDFSQAVESESVDPGESVTAETDPITLETVDDYEFALADADASLTVRPDPETAAVGETLAVGSDLAVTVDEVAFRESVFYPTSHSSGLSTSEEVSAFGAPSDHVLAVVTVTAENTGTETASAEAGTLGIGDAEWYGTGGAVPGALLGRSDDRFGDGGLPEIAPSESATGYYLAKVPRETARGTVEITGQTDATGTLPERVWTATPDGEARALPDVTLQSVEAPDATQLGREYDVTVTVANEGDAAGAFRGVIQWEDGGWTQLATATSRADLATDRPTGGAIRRELEPGNTAEIALSSFSTYDSQYTYRLRPFGDEWQVQFEAAILDFGDRLRSSGNADVVVEDLRTQDTVTAYDDWSEEEFEAEPDDGNQFIALQLRFEKRDESEDYATTPDTGNFGLLSDGVGVGDSTYIDGEIREDWYDPIDADLEERREATGWYFLEAPAEHAAGDLDVRYEDSGGFGSSVSTVATWEQ